ncbi:MAG: UDP-N-acetylmuramate:L-alanyl-gamma-D-glutamyl-meso-diaminopimelate ligase, partial [Candidatus Hydrogenedentes bacterium]|nr:UDP-N-acetylmuramate:L-alanyl-gamma-D-glutamyl-meso-diaminopimelate ligase [Candidatus Hydrogenedentota bacterium]
EYDTAFFDKRAKFFHYLPDIAVVTSVEFDHGDIYRDLGEIERAFLFMLRQIPASGWLVACADDPGAARLTAHAPCQVATYGFSDGADWRGVRAGQHDGCEQLAIHRQGRPWAELAVPLAGRHNLLNTLAAVAVAGILDVAPEAIQESLPAFRGVRRRMEVFLEANGITFIDDFAHHPTSVRETIAAAKARWPGRLIRVLFEPRSNTTVTNRFQDALRDAFREAGEVWLGPLHRAERIPPGERLDRDAIASALSRDCVPARWTDDVDELVRHLRAEARPGDVILILSNGAFGGIYDRIRAAFG